jgi:hypothetical protein
MDNHTKQRPLTLLEQTEVLLAARIKVCGETRRAYLQQVAKDTGLGLSWLEKFAAGKIPSPGIVAIQHLHDYLA